MRLFAEWLVVLSLTTNLSGQVKIAFVGDQGNNNKTDRVYQLILSEGAEALCVQGDFDYDNSPEQWETRMTSNLGADYPVFASLGNHDKGKAAEYQQKMRERLNRIGITWDGIIGEKSSLTYRGVFILLVAPGVKGSEHDIYLREKLSTTKAVWRIASWHKNRKILNTGGKGDDVDVSVYEAARLGGAMIINGHEHSYQRTHGLSKIEKSSVTVANTSNTLKLDGSQTFVAVSGLGGKGIRNQDKDGEHWAAIATSDQGVNFGALFGEFGVSGDPRLAHFYFKDIDGTVWDDFFVRSLVGEDGEPPPSGELTSPVITSVEVVK